MAITPIDVVIDPPLPTDAPSIFDQKAFAAWAAINGWAQQANALAVQVNTAADRVNDPSVQAVADNIADVMAVAGIEASVTIVAANSANVAAVAGNATNINAVAGNNANITAVAGNKANIDAVAGNKASIDTVAGIAANVSAVAAIDDEVTAVAGNAANINAVHANKANIDTVAGKAADVTTVAANSTNVTTVATNIAAVNTAATNMAAIEAAPGAASTASSAASTATTKAGEAEASALAAAGSASTASTKASEASGHADRAEQAAEDADDILQQVLAYGNGWTPVLAMASDGERRVVQVIDWTGGQGTKPATGYLGATGVVSDIAQAIDVRGEPGSGAVSSVNSVEPDGNGNVDLGIADIPGLEDALDNAGQVKTVAGKGPDGSGNVALVKGDVGLGNVDNTSDANKPISTATANALTNKVDKVAGKGLSTEDFTTALKDKLDAIAAQATKNETDAYLLNRANHTGTQAASTITGLATVATSGSYNDLANKPSIPTLPETVGQAEAEAGTATTVRGWTALRVRQSTKAYVDPLLGDIQTALDTINGV